MHLFHSRLPEKTAFLRLVELGLIVACCAKHASNSLWIKATHYSLPFSGQDQAAKNKTLQVFSRSAVPRIQFNFGQLPKCRTRRDWLLWCMSVGEFQRSRLFQKIRSWLKRVIKQLLGRLEERSNGEMGPPRPKRTAGHHKAFYSLAQIEDDIYFFNTHCFTDTSILNNNTPQRIYRPRITLNHYRRCPNRYYKKETQSKTGYFPKALQELLMTHLNQAVFNG